MSIMLGNLTVKQIEERLGIELSDSERKSLSSLRQENATNIEKNKWHCFDMPFTILCGSYDTAKAIYDILLSYSENMTTRVQIAIDEGTV